MRILVLNCYTRNSLAVINSLDESFELFGADSEIAFSIIRPDKYFKSSRLSGVFRYANPAKDTEAFARDVIDICNDNEIDAVIPTGTLVTNVLSEKKSMIQAGSRAKMLVEDYDKLKVLGDKWDIVLLCRELGIPTPGSVLIADAKADLTDLRALNTPLVLKPRDSSGSEGVVFFNSHDEAESYVRGGSSFGTGLVAQELIRGDLHDVATCARQGKCYASLTQERLMTFRDFGGGGIINRTTNEPDLLDYAKRLAKRLEWNGIFELDFIRDSEGKFYLIEGNPKVWGTTQLSTEAGVNVVNYLVELVALGQEPPVIDDYEVGLVYKWIFPECVAAWVQAPHNPSSIWARIKKTFRPVKGTRVQTNLSRGNLAHLAGVALNR